MSLYSQKYPCARKNHLCGECGGLIKFGESYCRIFAADEDGPWHAKQCTECHELFDELHKIEETMESVEDFTPPGYLEVTIYAYDEATHLRERFEANKAKRARTERVVVDSR